MLETLLTVALILYIILAGIKLAGIIISLALKLVELFR